MSVVWIQTSAKFIINLLFTVSCWKDKNKQAIGRFGCNHSSVESSASTILPPQVRIQCSPSTLYSCKGKCVPYFYLHWEKKEDKQRESGFGLYRNPNDWTDLDEIWHVGGPQGGRGSSPVPTYNPAERPAGPWKAKVLLSQHTWVIILNLHSNTFLKPHLNHHGQHRVIPASLK